MTAHDISVQLKGRVTTLENGPMTVSDHQNTKTESSSLQPLPLKSTTSNTDPVLPPSSYTVDFHLMGQLYLPCPVSCGFPEEFLSLILAVQRALNELSTRDLRSGHLLFRGFSG
jgi:hypothetical protein